MNLKLVSLYRGPNAMLHLPFDDVGYRATIHHQPFRHLQCDSLEAIPPDMMYGLVHLEIVVSRKTYPSAAEKGRVGCNIPLIASLSSAS